MELRHLKYFKTVAEELHFGRAARRLKMAQPPLSLQIRQLEEEMGVLLFHRTKRNVELSEEGKVFLEKVNQILENLDEAIETVRRLNRGEVGEIAVGFIATVAYGILPTIIKHYRHKYPEVHVELKQLTSAEQLKALKEETIQIAILSEPTDSEEINFEVIRKEPFVIALPKEHPLATETSPIELIRLANEPFIITGRKANQNHYDMVINSCYQEGFSPIIKQETEEMFTVLSLVAAGIGIALVPSSMQLLLQNDVVYRHIKDCKFNTVTAIAWISENRSPVVHTFIKLVRDSVIPILS